MTQRRILPGDAELQEYLAAQRASGATIVFTNGVFDLIHPGHVQTLRQARTFGDRLLVAINSDESVRRIKGPGRPILPQGQRLRLLAALEFVDAVTVFHEDTSDAIIERVRPDVLVKGGDYTREQIVGHAFVESYGGRVEASPFFEGYSTSSIIARIREQAPSP